MMAGYEGLCDKSAGRFGEVMDRRSTSPLRDLDFMREVKKDLVVAREQCYQRGLLQTTKWLSELLVCVRDVQLDEQLPSLPSLYDLLGDELDHYHLAKSYFDLKEYDRCAYFTEHCTTDLGRFLHLYSRYLSGEKKKNDDIVDALVTNDQHKGIYLKELHTELSKIYALHSSNSTSRDVGETDMDAWLLWLYGVVLKRLDLTRQSVEVLCQALHIQPLQWGAWLELAALITDREMLATLKLPDHWMRKLFYAHTYLELQLNDEALEIYTSLQDAGLAHSTYIMAQVAITHHNQRDVDQAVTIFKELEAIDPFRLDNLDTYSNLLYVKEMRVELSHLAHRVVQVDKYRVETCCVIGNYYSLRSQHEKAVQYFQRALRLNPHYLAAWTLMGHEYMEMKNTNAAIQCYRQAIEVNRRDYRAWYGLGQTYEILKLPAYCLYYFKQAQKLRPNDSRMLVALGESYEKLEKWEEAKKCFLKAHSVGDIEGIALLRLAKLYSRLGEGERAAVLYERYLQETEDAGLSEDRGQAYQFLASHCLQKNMLDLAYDYAQKCTLFMETRESGKTMLREIANRRQHTEQNTDDCGSVLVSRVRPRVPLGGDRSASARLPPLSLSYTP
ncbi:cell division cycle protein 23 homolog isoform X2 [Procambarus clarkii]|uniref:cell division cycle protein 23 homolog isoform X2 n=1 Tax=Procambarus clarkii TaxID=6728 RepID=UPI001E67437B|nr:cell division cycle protein 23 homolog isoform X2 [Procambarus clarkii]